MNPKTFIPQLFVGIGETAAFFTLRETYLHTSYIPGAGPYGNSVVNGVYQGSVKHEVRSFHHFNLSQCPVEAVRKAKEASEKLALPLSAKSTPEALGEHLREIHRATAAEQAARVAQIKANEAAWAADRALETEMLLKAAQHGMMPVGKYAGQWFTDLPPGYLNWLVGKASEFEAGSLMQSIAQLVERQFSELLLPPEGKRHFSGTVGKRYPFKATVLGVFTFEGYYGTTHISKMVTDSCEALVVKSGAFRPTVGQTIEFTAGVKAHDQYNGKPQTVLQRVKMS